METKALCVRLDVKLVEKLDKKAVDNSYNRAEAIREAIRRFVNGL